MRMRDAKVGLRLAVVVCAELVAVGAMGAGPKLAEEPVPPRVTMSLSVDATDIGRNLVKSRLSMPVKQEMAKDGAVEMRYVLWTPGNHTPSGPIENIGSLVFKADDSPAALEWERDPQHMELFRVRVPPGVKVLRAEMTYIAGQPNVNSRTTDSYGGSSVGVVNWNTVLLYPAGFSSLEIDVQATLARPTGWRFGTALIAARGDQTLTYFDSVPLAELVDCPVVIGEYVRTYQLTTAGEAMHYLHVAGQEAEQTEVSESIRGKLSAMVAQAMAVMPMYPSHAKGINLPFPRDRYHFMHALGVPGGGGGVEHCLCTLCFGGERAYLDAKESEIEGGGGGLLILPHEYFHAWCGKLRAPAGLVREDFSAPADTELLWVYEGLTDYYTDVLGARSGMITEEEFRQNTADLMAAYEHRPGRLWRSVEDSARAARHLRNPSKSWSSLRQGQDYYGLGALFWMEADLLIRKNSGDTKSLDDFCRLFFDVPIRQVGAPATYEREDVVKTLKAVDGGTDWDALIHERIERPADELKFDSLAALAGCRLEYVDEATELQKKRDGRDGEAKLRTSIGLVANKEGEITDVIPGFAA
ncbi:MAG TPA: hypothetical protein VG797_10330, partial [Phycisphaerales bacterium]|nr:hypothetical protein [Phycisphaerales bacterium]